MRFIIIILAFMLSQFALAQDSQTDLSLDDPSPAGAPQPPVTDLPPDNQIVPVSPPPGEPMETDKSLEKPEDANKAVDKTADQAQVVVPEKKKDTEQIFDDPDTQKEERLHQMYGEKVSPISDDRWDSIAGGQEDETFRLARHSTLAKLSYKLFGDSKYWPKIWSANSGIENPHNIPAGTLIHIRSGSEEDAPQIVVAGGQQALFEPDLPVPSYDVPTIDNFLPEDAPAPTVMEEEELEPPVIPAPFVQKRKSPGKLPKTFVDEARSFGVGYDASGVEVLRNQALTESAQQIPSHLWIGGTPRSAGEVTEIEQWEQGVGTLQTVFVEMKNPCKVGDTFSVVTLLGDAVGDDHLIGGKVLEVGGRIEIVNSVSADKNLYKAIVIKSVGIVHKGSLVLTQQLPHVDFVRRGPIKNVAATVIGGEFENRRKIFGQGAVIYLNQGTGAGLMPGDLVSIRSVRNSRRDNTMYPEASKPIAVAKIVHAQPEGSTAFLIETEEEVRPGDLTGGPLPKISHRYLIQERAQIIDIDDEIRRAHERISEGLEE